MDKWMDEWVHNASSTNQRTSVWNSLHSKSLSLIQINYGAKLLQSCLTLCDPRDGSPPGSPVPGILQAGTLEWVAISSSNAWKWKVKMKLLSRVRLLATPRTAAYQTPPSMGFSKREYWNGLPLPSPTFSLEGSFSSFLMCSIRLFIWDFLNLI